MHIGLEKKGWPRVWRRPYGTRCCVPLGSPGQCQRLLLVPLTGVLHLSFGSFFKLWSLTCSLKRVLILLLLSEAVLTVLETRGLSRPPRVPQPRVWPNPYCVRQECTGLSERLSAWLFKRPFMKFVFEPHKILGKLLNHLKEEIRVGTNFVLKTHSQRVCSDGSPSWGRSRQTWLPCVLSRLRVTSRCMFRHPRPRAPWAFSRGRHRLRLRGSEVFVHWDFSSLVTFLVH